MRTSILSLAFGILASPALADHAIVESSNTIATASPCSVQVVTPDIAARFPGANRVVVVPRIGPLGFRRGETSFVYRDTHQGSVLLGTVENKEGPLGIVGKTYVNVAPGAAVQLGAPGGC